MVPKLYIRLFNISYLDYIQVDFASVEISLAALVITPIAFDATP